ncbi:PINIT domain-containing protein [Microdochium trichocladiopsis]|uniref:PINIT domain-containing protein n=1 Tax=Microdochium trichocladiopsis TaxID=1682393 RepID=A0A9P8YKH3_9PEZI|nr:PINIT domain-containing protein [Microdochium trichocladiopsis]KAH7041131.1 PINIT domain-containing protein [Microdochium trichocladiopsis]
MASPPPTADIRADIRMLERSLNTLLNKQLQQICATNGLATSGVKASLQNRIKNALHESCGKDPATYQHIRSSILAVCKGTIATPQALPQSSATTSYSAQSRGSAAPGYPYHGQNSVYQQQNGYSTNGLSNHHSSTMFRPPSPNDIEYKPSPFYSRQERIGNVKTCEAMSQHRNSVQLHVRVSDMLALQKCVDDKSYRVMVFCAGDLQGAQDISFPHQSEIKVNGGDIKANTRGLKGKPGSTRPVDITDALRLKQYNYANTVDFTYALTSKKFYVGLYICKTTPISDLVAAIKNRKIRKETVIREISDKANDPDVGVTHLNLSLKCPLSYTRLRTPCRGTQCKHITCFDATSYLQLQEQGPQWLCPLCNGPAPYTSLAVDEYAKEILEQTSESEEQVTIEPDGSWRPQSSDKGTRYNGHNDQSAKLEDDDDLLIISNAPSYNPFVDSTFGTPMRQFATEVSTPNGGAREPPVPPRSGGGTKRTAEVIDLTLSSDDEEPVMRPAKRQNLGTEQHMSTLPFPNNYSV